MLRAAADGEVMIRRQLRRAQMIGFFAKQPACLVGTEACANAYFWGRSSEGWATSCAFVAINGRTLTRRSRLRHLPSASASRIGATYSVDWAAGRPPFLRSLPDLALWQGGQCCIDAEYADAYPLFVTTN